MITETASRFLKDVAASNERHISGLKPEFHLRVGFCKSYTCLLRGEADDSAEFDEVLDVARATGRILVSGRGGSGKTTFLRRLLNHTIANGDAGIFLDLLRWDNAATHAYEEVQDRALSCFDFLLRKFSEVPFDISGLDMFPPSMLKLIVVDGLNETPGHCAKSMLEACDAAAAFLPGVSIVVGDRLVRRDLADESRWRYLATMPIDHSEIASLYPKQVDDQVREMLGIPFMLDRAIKGELEASPEETIRRMVVTHASLNEHEIAALARSAFEIYNSVRSRAFDRDAIPSALLDRLFNSGLLSELPGGRFAFTHHWIHDCLASMYVADQRPLWLEEERHTAFDAITFGGNSFDAVAFVLRILCKRKASDDAATFLRAVYDWNPYAAGFALSEAEAISGVVVPEGMRAIVLFMLALRRFEHQLSSAQRASDALDLFKDQLAITIRGAKTFEELVGFATKLNLADESYQQWLAVFAHPTGEPPSAGSVAILAERDSVRGWTMANMLKQMPLTAANISELISLGLHTNFVVRWRAVHALGSSHSEEVVAFLFDRVLNDQQKYVRFGAVRSLIEIAVHAPKLTDAIVQGIVGILPKVREDRYTLEELINAAFVLPSAAPERWAEKFAPVFNQLIDLSDSIGEIDRWSGLAAELRIEHRREAA